MSKQEFLLLKEVRQRPPPPLLPVLNQEQEHRGEHSDDRTGSSKQESEATAFHFTVNASIRGHISGSNEGNKASSSWQQ
jgi:hypothetical protein